MRIRAWHGAVALLTLAAACNLSPQPLPPGAGPNSRDSDGSTPRDDGKTGGGVAGGDAAATMDASFTPNDDAGDFDASAALDAGSLDAVADGSDAAADASDATGE